MVQKQQVRFQSFDGGLNTKENPALIEQNEFAEFTNLDWSVLGLASQRLGERRFNQRIGDDPIDGLALLRRKNVDDQVLIISNGDIWLDNALEASNVFTTGNKIDWAQYRERLFMVDASNNMQVWDGTSVYKAGLTTPDSGDQSDNDGGAPNPASGGAGNLTGDYRWRVTYISNTTESLAGDSSTELTLSSNSADLSDIPVSSESRVNARGIYRTLDNGARFFKVGELNDNTSTTFTDNVEDGDLGLELETEAGEPPAKMSAVATYHNFLFGAGTPGEPHRLYWSNQLQPEKWDALNFVDVHFGQGSEITALEVQGDRLWIFKNPGVAILQGFTESDFTVDNLSANFGAPSNHAVTEFRNLLFVYDGDNVFQVASPGDFQNISTKIEPELEEISDPTTVVLEGTEEELHMAYENTEGRARELVYRLDRESWTKYEGRAVNTYANRTNDTLLGGSRDEGVVHELDVTRTGDSLIDIHTATGTSESLDDQYRVRQFTADNNGKLTDVFFRLSKVSANHALRGVIYDNDPSTGEPDDKLATSTDFVVESDLPSSFDWQKFTFEDPIIETDDIRHIGVEVVRRIQVEHTSDVSGGRTVSLDADYQESVSLTADTGLQITHNLDTNPVQVQFFDSNLEKQSLKRIEMIDADTIEIESSSTETGDIVVSVPDATLANEQLSAGTDETIEHDLGSVPVVVQLVEDDEIIEVNTVSWEDTNSVTVNSASDRTVDVLVSDSDQHSRDTFSANTRTDVLAVTGDEWRLIQFYDDNTLTDIQEFITAEATTSDTLWEGESGTFETQTSSTSPDEDTWSQSDSTALNMRLYTDSIPWAFKTKKINLDETMRRKQSRMMTMDIKGFDGTITVEGFGDGEKESEQSVEVRTSGTPLGSFVLDQDRLAGIAESVEEFSLSPDAMGRSVQFRISSFDVTQFSLETLELLLYVRRRR